MKKILSGLFSIILVVIVFSCSGSGSDKFLGKWVPCNKPAGNVTITKNGNKYNLHVTGKKQPVDIIAERNSEEVLSGIDPGGDTFTLRYDKQTNHLLMIQVIDHTTRVEEWCK